MRYLLVVRKNYETVMERYFEMMEEAYELYEQLEEVITDEIHLVIASCATGEILIENF